MFYGVLLRLDDPWAQGSHVDVMDHFTCRGIDSVIKFDSVGSTTGENDSRLEWFDDLQCV